MMKPRILLINPPIYDFAAYDFWLKPYGLLTVAGYLRGKADFALFDYLDRLNPFLADQPRLRSDQWGRGRFYDQQIDAPVCLSKIPRHFRRFGLPRRFLAALLARSAPFDYVLIQTMMTYWYPGVQEVIADVRRFCPRAKVILGGNYTTLCPEHAETLDADLCIHGRDLQPLWRYLRLAPDLSQPPLWEAYEKLEVGVLKLTDGCPFKCTYCSVPAVYGAFSARRLDRSLKELDLLRGLRVKNIAFYDDALLYKPEKRLMPLLNHIIKQDIRINLHSPNALNARFLTAELAELMIRAGFKTFYLGFESASTEWQKRTGPKVSCDELARAVDRLVSAGADPENITAYQILGHPHSDIQHLEESMGFVNSLGIRGMLADFSPIPGTPDGDYCNRWVDMSEPLVHNKTAFAITRLGFEQTNRLKDLQRRLNRKLAKRIAR